MMPPNTNADFVGIPSPEERRTPEIRESCWPGGRDRQKATRQHQNLVLGDTVAETLVRRYIATNWAGGAEAGRKIENYLSGFL